MCQHVHRRSFLGTIAALFPALKLRAESSAVNATSARAIAGACNSFIAVLRPELRKDLEFSFEDPERKDWSNVPHFAHPRKGARIGDFNARERSAAHTLLRSILSSQGYYKALAIMERDEFLGENSEPPKAGAATPNGGARFGSEFYFLDVFGKPGGDAPWGVQLDGHHLAVNVTVIGDLVAVTPAFFGAEPAVIPSGRHAGWEVLGGESSKGLCSAQLAHSSSGPFGRFVRVDPRGDLYRTGPGRRAEDSGRTGLAAGRPARSARIARGGISRQHSGRSRARIPRRYPKIRIR
jgi:hypothetical protein